MTVAVSLVKACNLVQLEWRGLLSTSKSHEGAEEMDLTGLPGY